MRTYRINIDGVMLGTQYAIPLMTENGGGSIVNISSISALTGMAGAGAYMASKGAVRSLPRVRRSESYQRDRTSGGRWRDGEMIERAS